jgi:hypothetical protein
MWASDSERLFEYVASRRPSKQNHQRSRVFITFAIKRLKCLYGLVEVLDAYVPTEENLVYWGDRRFKFQFKFSIKFSCNYPLYVERGLPVDRNWIWFYTNNVVGRNIRNCMLVLSKNPEFTIADFAHLEDENLFKKLFQNNVDKHLFQLL